MLTFPLNPSDPFSHPLILSKATSHSLHHPHSHSHFTSATTAHFASAAAPYIPHLADTTPFSTSLVSSLPSSPCQILQTPLLLPHLARLSSTSPRQALLHLTRPQLSHLPHLVVNSSFCNENFSFCSKTQICNF